MKFYYNGQLVRTSNHAYKFACLEVRGGKYITVCCSKTRDGAEKAKNHELSDCDRIIENVTNAIKAKEAGKKGYYAREGRRTYFLKFDDSFYYELDYMKNKIESLKERIEDVKNNWVIVELQTK